MDVAAPTRLRIATRSGSVHVRAIAGGELAAENGRLVHDADGWISIGGRSASDSIAVSCPAGTDVVIGTSSGRVEISGQVGAVRVMTMSGRVRVEAAMSADIRSKSAETRIDHCQGDCRVVTASGAVVVGDAGQINIATHSGSVDIGTAAGGLVRSVNGSVRVGVMGAMALSVQTVSASVDITVPRGVRPRGTQRSRSGSVRVDCPPGGDAVIDVTTQSGSIRIAER